MLRRCVPAIATAVVALFALSACGDSDTPSSTEKEGETTSLQTVTDGKLTIGTGEPAYPPWVEDDKPESGQGFEAAVAYAVADKLGFAKEDVVWIRTPFDAVISPGPKDFDFNLQQFSISEQRKKAVDFSSPYYVTSPALVSIEGNAGPTRRAWRTSRT